MTRPTGGPAALFCPADRPDRVRRAAEVADFVIVDLEDSVRPENRDVARAHLVALSERLDPQRTIVRVNPPESRDLDRDLDALSKTGFNTVMLAKAESDEQVRNLGIRRVIALCETPRGVVEASSIAAAPSCVGLMWGSEDLALRLGIPSGRYPDAGLRDVMVKARLDVLMAAKANGVLAIDTVFVDIWNRDGLWAEALEASQSGFDLKACIHPDQILTVRDAFRPSADEIRWALGIVAAVDSTSDAVIRVGGVMVDEPVVLRARNIIGRSRLE